MDDRLASARLRAAHLFPYFAHGLFSLIPVECVDMKEKVGFDTMGVDKNWRMLYSPKCFDKWSVNELSAVMVHEVEHLLRDHPERALPIPRDLFLIWNLAADCEINDDHKKTGLPEGCVFPKETFKLPEGLTAEEYFRLLMNHPQIEFVKVGVGAGKCGSCATGEEAEGGDKDPVDAQSGESVKGISKREANVIRNTVAKEIIAHKGRGNVPEGIMRWAEEHLKSTVPWRTLLQGAIRGVMGNISGMVNYSYSRPARRQSIYGKIIMPSLRAPIPEVAMLIDTSGSMSEKDLGQAIAEVEGVLKGLGSEVTVISNDAGVGAVTKVRRANQSKLVGGGGTDLGPGILRAAEIKPMVNFLVIVSDCDAAWGNFIPRFPVIVVKVGNYREQPPSWVKKTIQVDPNQ